MAGNENYLAIHFDRLCSVHANEKKAYRSNPPYRKVFILLTVLRKKATTKRRKRKEIHFLLVSDILLLKESLTLHQDTLKTKYAMN